MPIQGLVNCSGIPVVPHKAVAEVSKNRKPIGEVGCCESRMAGRIHKCPTPAIVFGHARKPAHFAHFWQGAQSLAPAARTTSEHPKVVRTCSALNILTRKCASRHNSVHFFDIWNVNFQKGSEHVVLLTFWLGNVLCATRACTFFDIWTSKSAPNLVCFVHFWLGHALRATTACNFSSLIWPAGSAPPL